MIIQGIFAFRSAAIALTATVAVIAFVPGWTSGGDVNYDFEFLDEAMKDSIDFWGIRGASIAFYDKVRTSSNLSSLYQLSRINGPIAPTG